MRHLAGNDIGANVGNHTLYVCKFLRAAQAIVFEPSALTMAILQINVRLNGRSAGSVCRTLVSGCLMRRRPAGWTHRWAILGRGALQSRERRTGAAGARR
jgi:hypothetical protein